MARGVIRIWRRVVAPACLVAAAACAQSGPREVVDDERGCRYVVPAGWAAFADELRSPRSSLFSIRVFELLEADPTFRKGLPDTIVPQLEEWARSYYVLGDPPARAETTVGGLSALVLTYAVRVRADDAQTTKLVYWVVEAGHRLFVLRAVLPPAALAEDEPAVGGIVESWQFSDTGSGDAAEPQGAAGAAAAAGARASASSVTMPIFRSSPPAAFATPRICTIPS